jgi:hypothetical protein
MSEFASRLQGNIKKSSQDLLTFAVKLLSGSIIALAISLVVQEMLGKINNEINMSFLFVIFVVLLSFLKVVQKWTITSVLIFDLIFILIGMILRLYIMTAPGA